MAHFGSDEFMRGVAGKPPAGGADHEGDGVEAASSAPLPSPSMPSAITASGLRSQPDR
ncbi:MAG: hypothetical protein ABIR56_14395 [Polaromonas sp.]